MTSATGKLPGYDEALQAVLAQVQPLPTRQVPLHESLGAVLRCDIMADRDQPPFDRAAMDGFAVRAGKVRPATRYQIVATIAAGAAAPPFPDDSTSVMRIATGAPLPTGADSVVRLEQAQVESPDGAEYVQFSIDSVQPWQHVHRRGSDAATGQVVIRAGTCLGPHHVGIAAIVGATDLEVSQVPAITLLTSGDEVLDAHVPSDQLQLQQIRNSNGPMLRAFFDALGTPVSHHVHVIDDPEQTLAAVRHAIAQSHLVVTTGGVSAGGRDLLPWAWQQISASTVLRGVAIQPGKPLLVARLDDKLVVGLPGNPVSVLATAHLFAWPIVRKMLGQSAELPWRNVLLANSVKANASRQLFRAARRNADNTVEVLPWHGSGDLIHTANADGLVRLPVTADDIASGAAVPFLPFVR